MRSLDSSQYYVQVNWHWWSFKNFQFHFLKLCNIDQAATKAISEHVLCIYLNLFFSSCIKQMFMDYPLSASPCINKANHPVREQTG